MREINDIDLKSLIESLTGEKFNRENKIYSPFKKEKTPSFCIYFDSNCNKSLWWWSYPFFAGTVYKKWEEVYDLQIS